MPNENYDIVGSFNNQRVSSIDSERSINVFEYVDPLAKKPKCLISTSGLINTGSIFPGASGGFRAQFVFQNNNYVIIGNSIYRITSSGTISLLGIINTTTGHVGIDANTFQIIFVDGQDGYIFDTITSTFQVITDPSFPLNPIDCCFLDGFFVVANANTNNFQLSSFNQGLVWSVLGINFTYNTVSADSKLVLINNAGFQSGVPVTFSVSGGGVLPSPLNSSDTYYVINDMSDNVHIRVALNLQNARLGIYIPLSTSSTPTVTIHNTGRLQLGSINSHPGNIVACRTLHRRLFLFSEFYTEIWENAGSGTDLPFRRNNNFLIELGTPCTGSISFSFDTGFFLSQDRDGLGSVMQINGVTPVPASNRALDFQLSQYAAQGKISDCVGFLIKENGLIFYRMNFTAANHTYVYNVTISNPQEEQGKLWHEENTLVGNRHPSQNHSYFNGLNYVGHYNSPTFYILDSNTFTNDGEVIPRIRIGRPVAPSNYKRTRIDRFQLDLLQGNTSLIEMVPEDLLITTESGEDILTESYDYIIAEQKAEFGTIQNPVIFLSISKDGGQTYGFKLRENMGELGQRTFRTLWRKLGVIPRGQAFVPKIEFYTKSQFIILGASWCYEILPE